jgi:hypothetical protein
LLNAARRTDAAEEELAAIRAQARSVWLEPLTAREDAAAEEEKELQ